MCVLSEGSRCTHHCTPVCNIASMIHECFDLICSSDVRCQQFRKVMPCCRFQTIEITSVVFFFANIHIKCCDLDGAFAARDRGENVKLSLSQLRVDGLF